jgi:hypothetical protein
MEQAMIVSITQSRVIYKIAGAMAIFIVLAGLTDAVTSMGTSLQDNRMIPIVEWFTLFQTSRFEAFSRLGVINIITLSCCIPVYLAFDQTFREERAAKAQGIAAFAMILFFTGVTIYLSSNSVFALFAVSQKYAAATPAQKPLLTAAGQALLAQGTDLTPGTFAGLFFTQIAGLLITSAMLRGSVFGQWTGRIGLVGFGLMSAFFILTAFFPTYYGTAMIVSAPGALLMLTYQILLARKFLPLGK